jgi:two-component system chemotaxis response regulator CheB
LVADDAVLFRRLLTEVLSSIPGVEVVGAATNGRIAIQKVRELKPDLLTLDIEMPEMDGLAVLDALTRNGKPEVQVIVVSAPSKRGRSISLPSRRQLQPNLDGKHCFENWRRA